MIGLSTSAERATAPAAGWQLPPVDLTMWDRAATVRAAAVAANFQMMNRLVDATGVPIGASMRAIAVDLGLEPAPHRVDEDTTDDG